MIYILLAIEVIAIIIAIIIAIVIHKSNSDNSDSSQSTRRFDNTDASQSSRQFDDAGTSHSYSFPPQIYESEEKQAGRIGENVATNIIRSVLREGDYLFTNISITYDEKPAEMDNIIVNKYCVFIIEVKNYKGRLYGNEEDFEWVKYKDDGYGNTFEKNVKNPIWQVKRQVYILAKYLEYYGPRIWVDGYVLLLNGGSPVESQYILSSVDDIDKAIHVFRRNRLDKKTVENIVKLLED